MHLVIPFIAVSRCCIADIHAMLLVLGIIPTNCHYKSHYIKPNMHLSMHNDILEYSFFPLVVFEVKKIKKDNACTPTTNIIAMVNGVCLYEFGN